MFQLRDIFQFHESTNACCFNVYARSINNARVLYLNALHNDVQEKITHTRFVWQYPF